MASIGTPGSATYGETLTGIEEMMVVLPDNLGNEISAQDMRNVVYTLYDEIQNASMAEFLYTDTPSNVTVGGLVHPVTFASMSLFTLFNRMFHKDFPPSGSLEFVGLSSTTLDFKQPNTLNYAFSNTGFDELNIFNLKWTATKATFTFSSGGSIERTPTPTLPEANGNPLFSINVPAAGGSAVVGPTKPRLNVTSSYVFKCQDIKGNPVSTSPISISYAHRWYWGRRPNRGSLTSTEIRSLDGAGVSGNGSFGSTFVRIFQSSNNTALDPQGQYICFAWPTSWGTPLWKQVAGYSGWASKVQTFNYINFFGYSESYDVYISLEPYGTKLDYLEIQKSP